MASINLIESFQEFKDAENIDRPTLMNVMEDVFKTLIRKKYGSDENFDVIVNDQKGDLEIFRRRTIVDDDDLYNTLTVLYRSSSSTMVLLRKISRSPFWSFTITSKFSSEPYFLRINVLKTSSITFIRVGLSIFSASLNS